MEHYFNLASRGREAKAGAASHEEARTTWFNLNRRVLVINRKLGITDDVYEQDIGDLELDFFFLPRWAFNQSKNVIR